MMKKTPATRFASLLLGIFLFSPCGHLEATLGEWEESVAKDEKALVAKRVSTAVHSGYTVKELHSDSVVVREYVAASGIVFAVSWKGLIHPDLQPLLGSYASEYEQVYRRTPRKRGSRQGQWKAERVVVEKWGHMRNLQGRAYAPALIPSGVSIDEIQ